MEQKTLFGETVLPRINVSDTTFRGGLAEPMHSWYPYLEGYSSGFVKTIINHYNPKSERILDPFSGAGTTVLQSMRMGKKGFYCEINPLMQFLTKIKINSLSMNANERYRVISELSHLNVQLSSRLHTIEIDKNLKESYESTFKNSKFFTNKEMNNVLRARTLIDELSYKDQTLADYVTVAVLASLIPTSLLIRAGDLRYKTPRDMARLFPLEYHLRNKLSEIVADLKMMNSATSYFKPLLVCENAADLSKIHNLEVDTVITSPPYANGTNYFRNTKLELWFLRCLNSKDDLKSLRMRAVTAGINDVQKNKYPKKLHIDELSCIIKKLEEKAYDRRIPKLIECYFSDLHSVFKAITERHVLNDGVIAIDIGDSIFAGVKVPTDEILSRIFDNLGFAKKEEILLRKRQSHDGTPLKQVLLVFGQSNQSSKLGAKFFSKISDTTHCNWEAFKTTFPHRKSPYSSRNWGHPLHSLCSYEGKLKPSLAHHLVKIFLPKGGRLLDPFAGVGTIPFEAALQGSVAFGFEISPAGFYITKAKIGKPKREQCIEKINSLKKYLEISNPNEQDLSEAKSFGYNRKLPDYYEIQTLKEILLARKYFIENKPKNASESLVFASLLHILHGNRPYALSRRSHPITPFVPTGPFEYRPLIPRLLTKVNRSLDLDYPLNFTQGEVFEQDSTLWWPSEVNNLDLILTSPPFFDSTRFYMKNWLRLWFCGWNEQDFAKKPNKFVDILQKKNFSIYESIFRQSRERLNEDGIMVLHLGRSKKCDMAKELSKIASPWFNVLDSFEESVVGSELHGMKDKGTVQAHQYLILK